MKHLKIFDSFVEEVNEGSFHVALFKARNEGAKEFEFKGKVYPVKEKRVDEEAKLNEKETLIFDAIGKDLQSVGDKIDDLLKTTTDQKWIVALKGIQSAWNSLEDKISKADQKLGVINEGVVSIKGGRILAHKVLNKLVDMEIIPVKKKTEDLVEAIASLLATTSMAESLNEAFEVHYSDGVRASKKFGSESQAISFAKDLIKNKKGLQFVDVFNAGSGFHSTADTDAIVAWWGDGSYSDNKSKNDPKLAAKKIDESEVNEAMVQVAGKSKPSGAQVLATVLIDHLMERDFLKPGAGRVKNELVADLQKVIMDNTF